MATPKETAWPIMTQDEPSEWLNQVLTYGQEQLYSDMYFLPEGDQCVVKTHFQGKIKTLDYLNQTFAKQVFSIIKYRSGLNLSEGRRPQLGRFEHGNGFIRVSTVGDFMNQETAVLRFIHAEPKHIEWLIPSQQLDLFNDQPKTGLYIFAGPTGSGKTTTMNQVLKNWSDKNKMILTIEDPVEIQQEEFLQLQVNEQAKIDYPDLIKVALRHRPDILVIGEIRDRPTAKAALEAALAGHLVVATLHANSETKVVERLMNLGLSFESIKQVLVRTVYQRLMLGKSGKYGTIIGSVKWQDGYAFKKDSYRTNCHQYFHSEDGESDEK